MIEEYRKELPKWIDNKADYDLVLSNDIDSLASCCLLKQIKGWDIGYYYSFDAMYVSKTLIDKAKKKEKLNEKCYVDIATLKGKSFDNHCMYVTLAEALDKQEKTETVNLNNLCFISKENYTCKYAGSTLLTIWSIYNYPLPQTEQGKMLLLAIDSAYEGFYTDFRRTQIDYMNILGFGELLEVIDRHDISDFEKITADLGLNNDFIFNLYNDKKGKIKTSLNLKRISDLLGFEIVLPSDDYYIAREYDVIEKKIEWNKRHKYYSIDSFGTDIFSFALTYHDSARYSVDLYARDKRQKAKEKEEEENKKDPLYFLKKASRKSAKKGL